LFYKSNRIIDKIKRSNFAIDFIDPLFFSPLMKVRSIVRKYILYFAVVMLSLLLVLFILRDLLLSYYLHKKIDLFNQENHAILKVEKIQVQWLASVMMTGISLKPEKGDTLLRIDSIYLSISEWKLLDGRIVFNDLELKKARVTMIRKGHIDNYSFLMREKLQKNQQDTPVETMNYAYAADRLTGFVFDKIPVWIHIHDLNISANTNNHLIACQLDHFAFKGNTFNVPLRFREEDEEQLWTAEGRIDRSERMLKVQLCSSGKKKIFLPFITWKWNAEVGFDTVSFSIEEHPKGNERTVVHGSIALCKLNIHHGRISPNRVSFDHLAIDYILNIGKDYAELDSSTLITFNKLKVNPYILYRHKPSGQITLRIKKPLFPAEELFSSIPQGLFTTLQDICVKGNLSFYLNFFADLSIPDSLKFECELRRNQFTVLSYGSTDLRRMNGPFLYTAFEKGEPVRTLIVGPENPNFRPIEKISPFLKVSVLTSEDPGFFQHRGFLPDAFRESIITNIKEKKFARGGSTISMQLVKNVFLNRNKTIARKFEEILLVWLIENQGLCAKERMFEVYLNIIEWGPLIYGANEAARFYFNKDASKLNLAESIFLASIIPKPKWFRYSFNETGHLRESQAGYFNLLSEKMLNRGLISLHDFNHLVPDVELKGPARLLLKKKDTVPADSVADSEEP
jgi:hypothetical protein